MTTSQWWVNVAVISPTFNQPLHLQILQQKLIPVSDQRFSVTNDFFSGRSKVAGDRIYCTIKQNVRFQEKMHFENNRLDQIQNGRLSAIILFHITVIW